MQLVRFMRIPVFVAFLLSLGVAACSETWQGAKEDTRENVKDTGQGLEKAGENIQKQTK